MVLTPWKRKVVQDGEDDDVQIVTLSVPKRKTTKNVTKKSSTRRRREKLKKKKTLKRCRC
jgi:hypothetical protein